MLSVFSFDKSFLHRKLLVHCRKKKRGGEWGEEGSFHLIKHVWQGKYNLSFVQIEFLICQEIINKDINYNIGDRVKNRQYTRVTKVGSVFM